jgi:hypothetical protein
MTALEIKKEIAGLVRKKYPVTTNLAISTDDVIIKSPYHEFYWNGIFNINGQKIYIYLQRYTGAAKRWQIEYIHIRWNDGMKALTKIELNSLLNTLKAK